MKSRTEIVSEVTGFADGLSMLGLLRLLDCARALRKKDIKEKGEAACR